ncbi:hypothetical protein [uncultured Aquimarina sp.]|uniref:hypothetical protein n=1 Tax=uncultured Aquimarina sp. TaxID=575652 RepID=UPI00260B1112|nr:hypothetical protein [uncultured Aquimarina sp.]
MKHYLSIILMTLVFLISSCSKEEISTQTNSEQQNEVTIFYNGISYTTQGDDNDAIDYSKLNEEIKTALLTAHVFDLEEENEIYLFDTTEELDAFFEVPNQNNVNEQKRIPVGTVRTEFFKYQYYRSYNSNGAIQFPIKLNNGFSVAELRDQQPATNNTKWHDRISSLHITNSLEKTFYVRLYEHKNYGGRTLTFTTPRHTVKFVPNLAMYGFDDITSGLRGWY